MCSAGLDMVMGKSRESHCGLFEFKVFLQVCMHILVLHTYQFKLLINPIVFSIFKTIRYVPGTLSHNGSSCKTPIKLYRADVCISQCLSIRHAYVVRTSARMRCTGYHKLTFTVSCAFPAKRKLDTRRNIHLPYYQQPDPRRSFWGRRKKLV